MSSLATIEIEGEDFGTMEMVDQHLCRGRTVQALGQAYFCNQCGRVWAKITMPGRKYFLWGLSCEACGNGHSLEVAGSLWMDWDREFNMALPRKVIDRELRIILKDKTETKDETANVGSAS